MKNTGHEQVKAVNPEFSKYKVAAINCEPLLGKKDFNILTQCRMVEEAAKNGAKLIALPEMSISGYCWYNRKEVSPYVETVSGPTIKKFERIAKQYKCWIVVGLAEVDPNTDLYYNSAVLVGPDGVIGTHRKTHPYISEPKWSKQGDLDHLIFDTPIGKIGMLICMDIHFIETARLEALRGADIIVHISNWLAEKTPAPYWITRAFENGCYVLESNRCGLERTVQFSGGSTLIRPDGIVEAYTDKDDSILYADVDINLARNKTVEDGGNKIMDRRPKEYMELLSNSYLWNPLDFFSLYGQDPLPKGKKSKISVVQMHSLSGDIQTNLASIIEKAEYSAKNGSELIVFPELSVTGFVDTDNADALAIEIPNPYIDKLIDLCMKYRIYLVVGLVEKAEGRLYNSAVLLGSSGLLGTYRKMHLSDAEKNWGTPGNLGFPHFNTPVGRIGILIGRDALFPEAGRILALGGTDIICCPSAVSFPVPYGLSETQIPHNYPIPRDYNTMHWHLWRVRAGENNCYLAFANQVGDWGGKTLCFGRSGIFDPETFSFPRKEIILSSTDEDIGYIEVDTSNCIDSVYPTNVVRRKDLITMRQPLWYDLLIHSNLPDIGISYDEK